MDTTEIKNEIRSYMVKKGYSVQKVVDLINEKYGRNDSGANLTNKLHRGTLRYKEALEIADVIGYKIEWIDQEKK